MAIEAKDIYNANELVNKTTIGYNVRDKNGQLYIKKFTNVLDYSLDLEKMQELYENSYRNKKFTFNINNRNYTQAAICLKFAYAYKEFNRIGKNVYIRAGYTIQELEFIDSIAIKNNILLGIVVNAPVDTPLSPDILGTYFIFEDGVYKQKGNIKTEKTKAELRKKLYENGFTCDGIEYVRFKRSSGSSRVGKCLFIDKKLYKAFNKWNLCGLKVLKGSEIDLAAFEAYISLPSSSIIDKLTLEPKNFLVIEDYTSVFKDTVVGVKYKGGELIANEGECEISNSIFDGESLLDESVFSEKYANRGMLLLRNRFFKSACFNTNIQQWFADNDIVDISQLNGFTLAKDISDIKIITTPSSIKYIKFSSLEKWFENLHSDFGIVKYEKPTPYFNGRLVQCHYQLLNTLQLSEDDIYKLLEPNLNYISSIRNDPDILRYHIKYPYKSLNGPQSAITSKNEIIYRLMGINAKFSQTKLYHDFRNDLVKSMIRNLKQGHILINGTYATLLGNGVEMLQHSIGQFKGKSILGANSIHCSNFEYGKTILGSRSPHINSGNVLLVTNVASDLIDEYFNLSKEIVYINSINENNLQRLNGADFDSDSELLTDEPILIEAAKLNYKNFLVPTSMVVAKKVKRKYTHKHKADLDVRTSVNKIGEIVNLSQLLNSIMWHRIHGGQTIEENKDLYFDICKLAVLSGIEIDRAKKEYELSSTAVINEMRNKYKSENLGMPMFFKMITLENGFEVNKKNNYKYFNTPMDYLQKQIASFNFRENRKPKNEFISFSDIIEKVDLSTGGHLYYAQRDRIIELVIDCKDRLSELYCDYDNKSKEDRLVIQSQAIELKQECIDYINNLSVNKTTMFLLLKALDDKKYKSIQRLIFTTLFGKPNMTFFSMLIQDTDQILQLEENQYGTIELFNFRYVKISPPQNHNCFLLTPC